MHLRSFALLATLALMVCASAHAQEPYPVRGRTLTLIVPYPPGGPSDSLGRMVAQRLGEKWGVNVVVDNKPGGELLIGSQVVANAKKDGYTIGLTALSFVLNGIFMAKPPLDPVDDFAHVGLIASSPNVLAVNASSPIKSFKELEAFTAANPAGVNYASCCAFPYFATELLKSSTHLRGQHIPYKGSAPAVTAVMAGEVTYTIDGQSIIRPLVEAGKLRALAVTARTRSAALPQVPHLGEVGVPGTFSMETWWGLWLPAGVDPSIVNKANKALNEIVAQPDFRKRIQEFGMDAAIGTPADMLTRIRVDRDRYSKLAREAHMSLAK